MVAEIVAGLFGLGFTFFFLTFLFLGAVEILGKIYGTFRCLARQDLSAEQRIIYLVLIWFVPLGWLIYFVLGTKRTEELFSEVSFL
ncbi:MAG: hypothetical protein ABEI58_00570 [Candidatus Nanohaloarchaea archaeon]